MGITFCEEALLSLREAVDDSLLQRLPTGVRPSWQLVRLYPAEHRLNQVELGTVRRQVVEVDALTAEQRLGRAHDPTDVDTAIVHDDDERLVGEPRQALHEVHQLLADQAAPL